MTIQPGQTAPDLEQDTTQGRIRFHEWAAQKPSLRYVESPGGKE